MSEHISPEQTLPLEIQQPPVFTDAEAAAILQAQAAIAATRLDAAGNPVYREYVMGATYDGIVVSVDEWSGDGFVDDHFVVRVGSASQLAEGTPLSEQKMAYGTFNAMRLRDGGTTILLSEFGAIGISAPQEDMLPLIDDKVLFPIGEDGKPFLPAATRETEAAAAIAEEAQPIPTAPRPEQVGVGGVRRFLRRHRKPSSSSTDLTK